MEENYFGESSKKTKGFIIALIIMLLSIGLSVNTDLAQFSEHEQVNIPLWFFYIIFGLDLLMIACVALIYYYRKIGVFLFPVIVFGHLLMNSFYLSTVRYSDFNVLFVYFMAILFVTIPRWKYFK